MESLAAKTERSAYNANYASHSAVLGGEGLPRRSLGFHPNGILCIQKTSPHRMSRLLKINNSSAYPVAFKIKTTHPRLYSALPNFGRIESRQSVIVNIETIPLSEEIVSTKKSCTPKFLVEVFAIVPEWNSPPLKDVFESSIRDSMDSQSHKFWVVYALPEGLVQAQIPDNAATVVYSASEKDLFNKQGGADKPTNGSRGGTLLRGQDQPDFLGIIEEQVQDTPGSGVDRVPGRIMPMNFCPVDRLHFQRTLNRPTSRSLIIKNCSPYLIAFKLETTVPEMYVACSTLGKIEPGQISWTTIERKPLLEHLPTNKKREHKFRVKFATIAPEQGNISLMKALQIAEENTTAQHYIIWMAPPVLQADLQRPTQTEENTDSAAQTEIEVKKLCQRMNISFQPSNGRALCFQRPLTRRISRSLTISNHDTRPMTYMLRATNPKSYFVCPGSGQIGPGQNTSIVERIPSVMEPPLDEKCQDQFLVEISAMTSPRQDSPIAPTRKVYKSSTDESEDRKFYIFDVNYLPQEGLALEESAQYEAGMAHLIPEEPFFIYPNKYLCFKRPLRIPMNSIAHVTIANISTRPMAFIALLTAQNARMYTVNPAAARIEPGEYLKIQVLLMPMKVEPPAHEPCLDVFSFLGTLIRPEQENLDLSNVWVAAESNKHAIFQKKLPVLFIPWRGLTPEEELMNQRKGLFDRLQDMEALEEAGGSNTRGLGETSEGNVYPTQITEAQRALIRQWSFSVTPDMIDEQLEQRSTC